MSPTSKTILNAFMQLQDCKYLQVGILTNTNTTVLVKGWACPLLFCHEVQAALASAS
jgi:hypothetical protein